jgi:DNA topoisomerase-1
MNLKASTTPLRQSAIYELLSKRSLRATPTICRKCYVHPEVLNAYMDGNLMVELKSKAESELRSGLENLKPEEAAVLALLRNRLAKEAEGSRGRARAA